MPAAERGRAPLAAAVLAYLLFVAYQSLAGGSLVACSLPLIQQGAKLSWSDGLANLVAYLPLGLLVAAWLGPRRRRPALLGGLLAIAGFSLTMELLQACLDGRVSSWFDWATNSGGGLLGLLALPRRRRGQGEASGPGASQSEGAGPAPWAQPAGTGGSTRTTGAFPPQGSLEALTRQPLFWPVFLCVSAWLALSLAPWRFTLDVSTIRGNLAFLRHLADWTGPDPWRLARHLFGWLVVGVALRGLWPGRAAATLALVAMLGASLAGQLLVARPVLSIEELLGMTLAAALAASMPSGSSGSVLARLVPVLALLSVGAYQLAPGRGGPLSAGFDWWPKIGRGGLLSALELSLLFCWLAFAMLLSLRWLVDRRVDIARRRHVLPAVVIVAMLASELAQIWIPGRTPDTSPPLLTALAWLVAWALFGHPGKRAAHGTEEGRAALARRDSRDEAPGSRSVGAASAAHRAAFTGRAGSRSRRPVSSPDRP